MTGYLEGLDKGPQEDADSFSLSQELDEASCSEQPQEAQVDEIILQQSKRNKLVSVSKQYLHNLPLQNTKRKEKKRKDKQL